MKIFTDQWDLFKEQARLNNNDAGIDEMLELLEANKSLMNWQNAEVLLDYVDLIVTIKELSTLKRTLSLVKPLADHFNMRSSYRLAMLETMIEELENPTPHDTPGN